MLGGAIGVAVFEKRKPGEPYPISDPFSTPPVNPPPPAEPPSL